MIFVRRMTFDSLYLARRNGQTVEITVPHGWTTRYDYDADVVEALWSRFPSRDAQAFVEHLRTVLTDPDDADNVMTCDRCETPVDSEDIRCVHEHNWRGTYYERYVCQSCADSHYWTCADCDGVFDTTTTIGENEVCERCRDQSYYFCDECDEYYQGDWGCDVDHSEAETCDEACSSPQQGFSIRNGDGTLRNDQLVTVDLPDGVISEVGLKEIACLLRDVYYMTNPEYSDEAAMKIRNGYYTLGYDVAEDLKVGNEWKTNRGTFTKRLSSYAHRTYGISIPADLLTKIGNLARDHSNGASVEIAITRDLNQSAEDFGHEDSCWWQSYHYSRCTLKTNGGFGMRTFNEWGTTGRAWVMPLKDNGTTLEPTFDAEHADAFAVFNGYGYLSGYAPSRVMAHLSGMSYRKISFNVNPMYVNDDRGYLVAGEDILKRHEGGLRLSLDQHSNLHRNEQEKARLETGYAAAS